MKKETRKGFPFVTPIADPDPDPPPATQAEKEKELYQVVDNFLYNLYLMLEARYG